MGNQVDIKEAKKLIGYCGIYCGSCGMLRGRIYTKMAQEFLEVIKAASYPDELTINKKSDKPDFDFNEFLKGLEYLSKENSGAYCQESCKQGGGVNCKYRVCAKVREIEICYECEDYPCEHFSSTFEKSPEKLKDYQRFKKLGLEGWIRFHAERAEKGYSNATRKYYNQAKKEK
jgi:hypothetical protein